jgi:hypothetical protein
MIGAAPIVWLGSARLLLPKPKRAAPSARLQTAAD